MKIGIYDPYLDDLGGGEKYMMTVAECLAKKHDVSVFWNNKEDFEKLEKRFGLDFSKIHMVPNIFVNTSFVTRMRESKKYDAIIFLSDGSIPVLLSKKLFVHIQQPLQHFQSKSPKDKLKLSRVTKFFCNSEFTKSFIGKKFGLKTVIVYPPVDLHPQKLERENIILHVGRFRVKNVNGDSEDFDYKKQGVMIKVFKEMIDQGLKNWKFVLAVSVNDHQKDQFEKMKKIAQDYPIEFVVNKSNKDLWEIYSKAKIYWHATGFGEDLVKNPEFAEHFGISTVEAMGAGGVPVVINAGGQKEIVQNGVNGFVWDTTRELQEKTLELIKSPKLMDKLAKQAVMRADYFTGERFCKQVNDMITS